MYKRQEENSIQNGLPEAALRDLSSKFGEETVQEAYDEILELYRKGQLFSEDSYEQFAGMMKDAPVKSMCLNVAHDCNLRCERCV